MKQSGFTLLEILVAFAMLAVLGGALIQLFHGGLRNVDSSAQISHAALLAKSRLTELQASNRLTPGEFNGTFKAGYRWTLRLEALNADAGELLPPSHLKGLHATLDILWEPDGRYRVSTLLVSKAESP